MRRYDFKNCVILNGDVYALVKQDISSRISVINDVCQLCDVKGRCSYHAPLCVYLEADADEYLKLVGKLFVVPSTNLNQIVTDD